MEVTMKNVEKAELSSLGKKLTDGVVDFCFLKKDGSIRKARGTLIASYFKVMPKGVKAPNPKVFTYYDLDRDEFRCFKVENFLGYYREV